MMPMQDITFLANNAREKNKGKTYGKQKTVTKKKKKTLHRRSSAPPGRLPLVSFQKIKKRPSFTNNENDKKRSVKTKLRRRSAPPCGLQVLKSAHSHSNNKDTKKSATPKGHLSGFVIDAITKVKGETLLNEKDFVEDMYQSFRRSEKDHQTSDKYLKKQPHIDADIRSALVNWMTNVHYEFRLRVETLYLAVNILDRYVGDVKTVIKKSDIICLGMAALMAASKYEEIFHPSVAQFIAVSDGQIKKHALLGMEKRMLTSLSFELTVPTAFTFLKRFLYVVNKRASLPMLTFHMSHYLCESSMQESVFLVFQSSQVAAAAIYLSIRLSIASCETRTFASRALISYSKYSVASLDACVRKLRVMISGSTRAAATSEDIIRRKYALPKYSEASKRAREMVHKE